MNKNIVLTTAIFAASLSSSGVLGADDAFAKDLKATIALQGLPCSEVADAKRLGDSNYNVTCKDGNRYHVYVNDKGRVIVQKM